MKAFMAAVEKRSNSRITLATSDEQHTIGVGHLALDDGLGLALVGVVEEREQETRSPPTSMTPPLEHLDGFEHFVLIQR